MFTTTVLLDIKSQHFLHTEQLGNFLNNYIVESDFTATFFSHLSDTLSRFKNAINCMVAIRDEFS